MDLETAKLVAFALWAESNEGVVGKSPEVLKSAYDTWQFADTPEDAREYLGEALIHKFDNYLTVWEAAEEPEAPAPEKETQVLTRWDAESVEAVLGPAEGEKPEPVKAPETPAEETTPEGIDDLTGLPFDTPEFRQEVEGRKKQRGKRAR